MLNGRYFILRLYILLYNEWLYEKGNAPVPKAFIHVETVTLTLIASLPFAWNKYIYIYIVYYYANEYVQNDDVV